MPPTHEVTNQVPPLVDYDVADDPALLEGLRREGADWAEPEVRELGLRAGSERAQEWGRLANEHPPKLRTHDRVGRRVDEVEFHPHWHDLMEVAVSHGLHAAPCSSSGRARTSPAPRSSTCGARLRPGTPAPSP